MNFKQMCELLVISLSSVMVYACIILARPNPNSLESEKKVSKLLRIKDYRPEVSIVF